MTAAHGTGRQLPAVLGGVLLILLILLLPDLGPPPTDESAPVQAFHGRILEIVPADPNGAETGRPPVDTARVEILEGERTGEVLDAYLEGPGGSQSVAGYAAGDEVVVTITTSGADPEPYVAVADRWRLVPLQLLIGLFALAVLVVGGWHGLRALVALGLTIVVIAKIILPLILQGVPPLPMAVAGASAITTATILLTEGASRSSLAAILGTTGGLALAGLLASVASAAAGFTYAATADLAFLQTQGGEGLDLRGILLAAVILGAVGVLDDVTVTQAVVVDELAERGSLRGRALFASAQGIGRSHIGATVNTLFLAYVGAALPLLVILLVNQAPTELVYNNEAIATEVVRTMAGSLGIIAAVPFTTFVATLLVGTRTGNEAAGPDSRRPRWAAVAAITGVVATLLVATAVLPGTQAHRAPLATPPPFVPGSSPDAGPPGPGGSLAAGESPAPEPVEPGGEPVLAGQGEPVVIVVDGAEVGSVAVARWSIATASGQLEVLLEVTYAATAAWPIDPDAWEILTQDGGEHPFTGSPALPGSLPRGRTATFSLRATPDADLTDAFIAYVDAETAAFVFLVALE